MPRVNRADVVALIDGDSTDIVMGVHWDPAVENSASENQANLDAICLLFDANGALMERVDPHHTRNVNGSVMHTGDSLIGASAWDDERIFVFLHALPDTVHALTFGVVSVVGHNLCDVAGASCHISDHRMERELIRVNLEEYGPVARHCLATLYRCDAGWEVNRAVTQNDLRCNALSG